MHELLVLLWVTQVQLHYLALLKFQDHAASLLTIVVMHHAIDLSELDSGLDMLQLLYQQHRLIGDDQDPSLEVHLLRVQIGQIQCIVDILMLKSSLLGHFECGLGMRFHQVILAHVLVVLVKVARIPESLSTEPHTLNMIADAFG